MSDSHGSSLPKTTANPSILWPETGLQFRKDFLQPHQPVTYSPLRAEQNVNDGTNGIANRGTQFVGHVSGITDPETGNEGFPFNVAGTAELSSTIEESGNKQSKEDDAIGMITQGITSSTQGHNENAAPSQSQENTVSKTSRLAGSSTPPGRRSVQFARPEPPSNHSDWLSRGTPSVGREEGDTPLKDRRGASLLTKIRALAGSSSYQSHTRSPSSTFGGDSINERLPTAGLFSADVDPYRQNFSDSPDENGSESDADGEQSPSEEPGSKQPGQKQRRKSRRPQHGEAQTAPTTPKTPFGREGRPNMFSSNSQNTTDGNFRPSALPRRATMTDVPTEDRLGVSEDEGRERLARGSPWKRGSAWVHGPRGMSYSTTRKHSQATGNETPRPSNFRRALTGFGASGDGADGATPFSPWKLRGDRTSSLSAAKWRQIKAGLKMIGQRRKAETTIDHAKSAELMAELTAGIPAVLILASMFQRDEHGNRRIPILLEQLKVKLTDSKQVDSKSGDRHVIFRIELEYGNGLTRMKWVIHRALRDFANLHARYKLQISAQKYIQRKDHEARTKLPHFPKSAFPYLRGIRGLDSESEEEEQDNDGTGPSGGDASGTERPGKKKRSRSSMAIMRRKSSVATDAGLGESIGDAAVAAGGVAGTAAGASSRKDPYAERQRRKLELYLQQMIRYLIFRPESNRLCKFLELSALGVRLAAEGSYHGKEGLLIIQSGKGVDFRKKWTPALLKARHGPKWFLVRHSYIVCVDSPEEMNLYDVFLVDQDFQIQTKKKRPSIRSSNPKELAKSAKQSAAHPQNHTLKISNSERKMRLLAKNERQLHQFEDSIRAMFLNTPWAKPNRFDSFAPVRPNCHAQWLVDGRDYMWNVSRAINMAKDVIYIHDWWLSPELYMRRPAAISKKWRLDRLLKRKAEEGVKVFVIMYRNIQSAIPIDSEYSKFSLLDLHPNVFVQRSPNQIRQGTFFWAHHEKICIVDHMVAFVGGIDLCFGRWDTPQHEVADDKLTGFEESEKPKDSDHCQLWPGKDYSNPRVQDFYALDKPYEEMYDRSKVPRMPWHDISMQVVGQPARDLTRHFVQRWNYILRQRRPTRPTPFLLPPPDFVPADMEALDLAGTCEVQILRSSCMWSMGTPDRVERSILNAYVKMIQQSDHFVYIENQFFVSSTEVEGTKIENNIGDAIVERIVRAYQNSQEWRATIVIPLMPGFQNTVDSQDGTSVRLIMQCQYRSINRGDNSIFGRLRAEGIEPEDYIHFFSLRSWGKIGPNKSLVTEQLYIHAKCMVVDDRIAIIGSANINERSMLGSRDSECAAVVRDTDMLWSTMAGQPYLVGRFPHSLRMRLMREHLGINVDEVMGDDLDDENTEKWENDMDDFHGGNTDLPGSQAERDAENQLIDTKHKIQDELIVRAENMASFNHDVDWEEAGNPNIKINKKVTTDSRVTGNPKHRQDVEGLGVDHMKSDQLINSSRGREPTEAPVVPGTHPATTPKEFSPSSSQLASRSNTESPIRHPHTLEALPLPPQLPRMTTSEMGLPMVSQLPALPKTDDTDIGGPPIQRHFSKKGSGLINSILDDMKRPMVDQNCMRDPLNDSFYLDTWLAVAENNTKIFRAVFRCMPDNEVKSWKEYKEYAAYSERFSQAQGGGKSKERVTQEAPSSSGPPGQASIADRMRLLGPIGEASADLHGKVLDALPGRNNDDKNKPMGNVEDWAKEAEKSRIEREAVEKAHSGADGAAVFDEKAAVRNSNEANVSNATNSMQVPMISKNADSPSTVGYSDAINSNSSKTTRRRRATIRGSRQEFHASDDMINKADAEELLEMIQGNLVVWPYDWLCKEEQGGNWLYSIDQLAPLEIYN